MTDRISLPTSVADHYDRLDHFYLQLWGEHVHHGLWTDPSFSSEKAVRNLVHRVARNAGIGEGTRVCDVGCGYGAPARLWAAQYGARVTGFTVSEAQYSYAQKAVEDGLDVDVRLHDFLDNDLPDETMDTVVAVESLTHIRDQPQVLREAVRLLRPGGRFVGCVWMQAPSLPEWARHHLIDPICEEGRLSGLPTATKLYRWAVQAGLLVQKLDDVTSLVCRTWTVVLRRFAGAFLTDPAVLQTLLDVSESERVFARTILRIWLAQHLGILRYGWLVATKR